MCIARCVSDSRPILCMGSKNGDIQINYLDDEAKPDIAKPISSVKTQGKLKKIFNFNKPKQEADEKLLLKLLHRN